MANSNESTDRTDVTRREVLRKSATATGAVALGAVTVSGSAAAWDTCARTPGYWKNHPDAWPVDKLTLGGTPYSKSELLDVLNAPTRGDKTIIVASQLIAAKLNLENGTEPGWGCVEHAIAHADIWLSVYPVGSGQHRWESTGDTPAGPTDDPEKYKDELDDYNNGERCACGGD